MQNKEESSIVEQISKTSQNIISIDSKIKDLKEEKKILKIKKIELEKKLRDNKKINLNRKSNNTNDSIEVNFTKTESTNLASLIRNQEQHFFLKVKISKVNEFLKQTLDNRELTITYLILSKNIPMKTVSTIVKLTPAHTKQILEGSKNKLLKSNFYDYFDKLQQK